jgi:hypothetical protein
MHSDTNFPLQNKEPAEVDLDRAQRLRQARIARGFDSARACSTFFGWNYSTYAAHENGSRNFGLDAVIRYARALRVPTDWLSYGQGAQDGRSARVRIEGYVTGNLEIHLRGEPTPDEIPVDAPAPPGIEADTLNAWRFEGDDAAPFFHEGDIVYTPREIRHPANYIGRICVVYLADNKPLIRVLRAHLGDNRYLLLDFAQRAIEAEIGKAAPILWTHHPLDGHGEF